MPLQHKYSESGQGLVEVALIIVLVSVVSILGLSATGTSLQDVYCDVVSGFGESGSGACSGALFSEDFLTLDKWHTAWGKWSIQDGKLLGQNYSAIFAKDFSGEDYMINIDSANLSAGNGYGVWFRSQNFANPEGYIFQYDPGYDGGSFLFRKWVDGHELSPFARVKVPGYDWTGEDHQVQIKVVGDTFTAYVDGAAVLSASDSTFTEGTIGLRTWDSTQVTFDDISITNP